MSKELQNEQAIAKTLNRIVSEIIEKHDDLTNIAFVGIRSRGVPLAKRIKKLFDAQTGQTSLFGELDITLYRDDLSQIADAPVIKGTIINFDITDKNIILVDDVLYTGRTIRAALTELADFGRAARIELAVLIDRGHREVPINANYTGKEVPTSRKEIIHVKIKETDGIDVVLLEEKHD